MMKRTHRSHTHSHAQRTMHKNTTAPPRQKSYAKVHKIFHKYDYKCHCTSQLKIDILFFDTCTINMLSGGTVVRHNRCFPVTFPFPFHPFTFVCSATTQQIDSAGNNNYYSKSVSLNMK